MLWIRSILFWVFFVVTILLFVPMIVLAIPLSFEHRSGVAAAWARLNLWWLRVSCGVRYEVEGLEHIPSEPSIVFAKHQSTWETLALQVIFPPQVWVLKRELLWIPVFGWGLAMLEPIAIDRKAGRKAVEQLVSQGIERLRKGRWVIIFPEGTRVPAGQRGRYKIGGAVLAEKAGVPVVPVAHNAGEFWPRHSFLKYPGTVKVVIGPPVPTEGRKAQEILAEIEEWIESRVAEISNR